MGYARALPLHLSLHEMFNPMLGGVLVDLDWMPVHVVCECALWVCVPLCLWSKLKIFLLQKLQRSVQTSQITSELYLNITSIGGYCTRRHLCRGAVTTCSN